MTTKAEFKKMFDKHMRLVNKFRESQVNFDRAIVEIWGFHYSDKDNDWIIDLVDIGNGIDYKTFVAMMDAGDEWADIEGLKDQV